MQVLKAYAGDRRTTLRTKLFDLEQGEARVIAHRGVRRLRDDERVYLVEGSVCGAMGLEQAVDFLMAA